MSPPADDDADDGDESVQYELREQHLDGPVSGTVESTLSDLGNACSVTTLRTARADSWLVDWLSEPQPHFSRGAIYEHDAGERLTTSVYADAFDALCFVEETTRARPVET